jgi:hypothetical protein
MHTDTLGDVYPVRNTGVIWRDCHVIEFPSIYVTLQKDWYSIMANDKNTLHFNTLH